MIFKNVLCRGFQRKFDEKREHQKKQQASHNPLVIVPNPA
jgi:hypothetical protein